MATVLEGFLVSLGFDIDQDQLARFNGAVAEAERRFIGIGKVAIGAGVAIGAAFAKSTAEINDLYKVSNDTGTSINGLLTLQGAVERVGGSAESVSSAFQEFASKAKTYGASFEQMVRNQLGINLRDANGHARDMSDVFKDMALKIAKLAKTDPGLAKMKAEAVGLGAVFDDIVKGDFPAELERSARLTDEFGKKIDEGADSSHRLMNEISQVWDTVSNGAMSATAQITDALKLDEKLSSFNNSFADFLSETINSQVQIIKEASGFFDWVGKVLFKSGDYAAKERQRVLESRVKNGTATDEEKTELKTLTKDISDNEKADKAGISRSAMKEQGLADDWDDTLKLKAKFFDVDTKDAAAMEALKSRKVTAEDLADRQEDSDAFMLGVELQKRERDREKQDAPADRILKETKTVERTDTVKDTITDRSEKIVDRERIEKDRPQNIDVSPVVNVEREGGAKKDKGVEYFRIDPRDLDAVERLKTRPVTERDVEYGYDDGDELGVMAELLADAQRIDFNPKSNPERKGYFDGNPYEREVLAQRSSGVTEAAQVNNSKTSTTVTQTINITTPDPAAAGRAVAKETRRAVDHGNRGLI